MNAGIDWHLSLAHPNVVKIADDSFLRRSSGGDEALILRVSNWRVFRAVELLDLRASGRIDSRACLRECGAHCEEDRDVDIPHRSNEKEISHGRVSWQTRWSDFGMGPLASSIG
jgi:hypothetical protein